MDRKKKAERSLKKGGKRIPNLAWRPFVATISKASHRKGNKADIKYFELSQSAVKQLFAILSR